MVSLLPQRPGFLRLDARVRWKHQNLWDDLDTPHHPPPGYPNLANLGGRVRSGRPGRHQVQRHHCAQAAGSHPRAGTVNLPVPVPHGIEQRLLDMARVIGPDEQPEPQPIEPATPDK